MRLNRIAAAAALACLILPAPAAFAHRVNLFAWVEGDTVFVECKYPDGRRVKEGLIRVLDAAGAELLNGKTDAEGKFSFKIPRAADLTVVLEAGMGHRADWPLTREELSPGGRISEPSGVPGAGQPDKAPDPAPEARPPGAAAEDIERAVEKALDRKLAPVLKRIAETRDPGPRLADVLGGLGYILGLVGIAAYFKSRKSR
jgi:nickel transport protein